MVLLCLPAVLAACQSAQDDRVEDARHEVITIARQTRARVELGEPDRKRWDVTGSYVRFRLTIVDLDRDVAAELCGIRENDISPNSTVKPIALIASLAAQRSGAGAVRFSLVTDAPLPGTIPVSWADAEPYVNWRPNEQKTDWVDHVAETVVANLKVLAVENAVSMTIESDSVQLTRPFFEFLAGTGPTSTHSIAIPEVTAVQRVGAETIRGGETAVFQLGEADHYGRPRIRLLFVSILNSGS
jgi:hypothetical protein